MGQFYTAIVDNSAEKSADSPTAEEIAFLENYVTGEVQTDFDRENLANRVYASEAEGLRELMGLLKEYLFFKVGLTGTQDYEELVESYVNELLVSPSSYPSCADVTSRGIELIGTVGRYSTEDYTQDGYVQFLIGVITVLCYESDAGYELVKRALLPEAPKLVIFQSRVDMGNYHENAKDSYSILSFNLENAKKDLGVGNGRNGEVLSQFSMTSLGHELSHHKTEGSPHGKLVNELGIQTDVFADEPYAVKMENRIRKDMSLDERTDYGGLNLYRKKSVVLPDYASANYPWFYLTTDEVYNDDYFNSGVSLEKVSRIRKEVKVCRMGSPEYRDKSNELISNYYEAPLYEMKHFLIYLSLD